MTKEEFLHHYLTQDSIDEVELGRDEYGRSIVVVIAHEGTFYRSEIDESWERCSTEVFKVVDEPIVVVPKQVTVTQYVVEEGNE